MWLPASLSPFTSEASFSLQQPGLIDISDPVLRAVAGRLMPSQDLVGLLLYGSYASHERPPANDIDLICVSRSREDRHFLITHQSIVVDVYTSTESLLARFIKTDRCNNNNFVLDAFVHGRCLVSGNGTTECLVALAKEVWEAGPLQPGDAEQRKIATAVEKAAVAARHFGNKAERSQEWLGIAQLKLGHLFQEVVHAYCRIHRLWASSIWEMLEWPSPRYQDLNAICRRYLRAQLTEERVIALNTLAQATLSKIAVSPECRFDLERPEMPRTIN